MHFFMKMVPPSVTAQERQVRIIKGRPIFYDTDRIKDAKNLLCGHLMRNKVAEPFLGPVELTVLWCFPGKGKHKEGEWKVTKPDTDNLQKMLKDCMTQCGFWIDDAQVVREVVEKHWVSSSPAGIYIEINQLSG